MNLRATITLDWEITGAEGVKDFDPQKVAEAMERHLNDYEDGRYPLPLETLRALIRNAPQAAIYSAMCGTMFERYGNRTYKSGPRSRSGVAGYIAGKRTEGIRALGPSIDNCVKVEVIDDDQD